MFCHWSGLVVTNTLVEQGRTLVGLRPHDSWYREAQRMDQQEGQVLVVVASSRACRLVDVHRVRGQSAEMTSRLHLVHVDANPVLVRALLAGHQDLQRSYNCFHRHLHPKVARRFVSRILASVRFFGRKRRRRLRRL